MYLFFGIFVNHFPKKNRFNVLIEETARQLVKLEGKSDKYKETLASFLLQRLMIIEAQVDDPRIALLQQQVESMKQGFLLFYFYSFIIIFYVVTRSIGGCC